MDRALIVVHAHGIVAISFRGGVARLFFQAFSHIRKTERLVLAKSVCVFCLAVYWNHSKQGLC
jgi:hypothetical protein